ncbi:MAG: hypothetical protein JXB26_13780 [Candidatus Aminicenantes bacterium]|nr:hypothetical protein [Candidatus Aminicenantes bacterium]
MMILGKIGNETFFMTVFEKISAKFTLERADLTASALLQPVRGAGHSFTG